MRMDLSGVTHLRVLSEVTKKTILLIEKVRKRSDPCGSHYQSIEARS